MPRFFSSDIGDGHIILKDEDAKHIAKVLRMQVGNDVTICDGKGNDFLCKIDSIGENVSLKILSSHKNETEPTAKITLYQALPKSDKFDFIVQKAVELGVSEIVAVQTKFCVSRVDELSFAKKQIRFNKIAFEAAKQSGRGVVPKVSKLLNFNDAILECSGENNCNILYYEHGGAKTNQIITKAHTNINVFIGSEGGFDADEIDFAKRHDVKIGTLGKLILRCETAPIVALALVLNATDNN